LKFYGSADPGHDSCNSLGVHGKRWAGKNRDRVPIVLAWSAVRPVHGVHRAENMGGGQNGGPGHWRSLLPVDKIPARINCND
jgi:hypothetical protein